MNLLPMNNPTTVDMGENIAYIERKLMEKKEQTMSKYIDYDAIDYRHDKLHDKSSEFLDGVIYMAERIENAPSIDIVRCKECRWQSVVTDDEEGTSYYMCGVWSNATDENVFCSYGERKVDNAD